jgi:hypothetical protein
MDLATGKASATDGVSCVSVVCRSRKPEKRRLDSTRMVAGASAVRSVTVVSMV